MSLQRITPATMPAITLATTRSHLRVTTTSDDALLLVMIAAAAQEAEQLCERALMAQTWRLTLDGWGCRPWICLRRPPVSAITAVRYALPDSGTMATLAASEYQADVSGRFYARLAPAYARPGRPCGASSAPCRSSS